MSKELGEENVTVVSEFCKSNVFRPGSRVCATKDPKVSFHLLIDSFCFSVGLRMIGGGKGKFITKELSKFLSKGGGKLRSSV